MKQLMITVDPTLPKLAWYARYDPRTDVCAVEVGPLVERDPAPAPRWVVAGVWSGEFSQGGFHREQHVFGSGLRLDDDGLHVVPASTTVDRCVYAQDGRGWHLSNSLVVLLGRMGASLEPLADHAMWSESPCRGIHAYLRQIPVLHPAISTVNQLIYESMRFSPNGEQTFFFRDRPRAFTSYRDYVDALENELRLLWANASAPGRQRKLRALTTTSRGYDSPAVTAMVAKVVPGLTSWSAPRSNTRVPSVLRGLMNVDIVNDDGREIARRLGATPRTLEGDVKDLPAELEAWCWATSQTGPELLFHPILTEAATQEVPTLWFTGHMGDGVWSRTPSEGVMTNQLTRSAQSGCSLSEARLACGAIDCAVPYLFARNMESIQAISNAPEMKPWQLDNDYDRPIPRRLVEESGISRAWFGFGKKAVAEDFESPLGLELRAIFFERSGWTERQESAYRGVNLSLYYASRLLHFVRFQGDRGKLLRSATRGDKRALARLRDLHLQTFRTCMELLSTRFARPAPAPAQPAAALPPPVVITTRVPVAATGAR